MEYKCPCCDGAIAFDAGTQRMKCPYCDTEFDVETIRQQAEAALPEVDTQQRETWQAGEVSAYVCQSCGGELLTDANTAATACPFCGNPVVLAPNVSGELKPDLIIPFKLDKEAAVAALKRHLKGKILLPKLFRSENHIRKIQGIYVPFWLFDATALGNAGYRATKVRSWADSRYYYTETSYYQVSRAGNLSFVAVPVDGASKMDNTLMESLEPYDLRQAEPFNSAFLAGYLADRYDVSAGDCAGRAAARMRESTEQALRQTVVGYSTVTKQSCIVNLTDTDARYALYPVWLLHTRYKDKEYLFGMNGQTGKFVGDLPIDWGAFWLWWFLVFFATAAIAGLICFIGMYM